jgi:hypothetical protein
MAAMADRAELMRAVELALAGDWAGAHGVVQAHEDDATACWIHAALHKLEGDAANSRYWYARTNQFYEAYADPMTELRTIRSVLTY